MLPARGSDPTPGFVALLRFRSDDVPVLMERLREAATLFAAFPGFVDARISRAIDQGDLIVLELAWETVGAYRRALSSYDIKVPVVPIISLAIDEPTAYEVLHVRDESGSADASGALAADAASVSLGSASEGFVPPAPS
ncbi:MAG: hypothetical protein RL134_2292 [Actinomycetota bacterium]|jgi:hypothetical protein